MPKWCAAGTAMTTSSVWSASNQMAEKRNVLPINIALAYVLCQPFPTFPLFFPRQLSETRTNFQALDIQLRRRS